MNCQTMTQADLKKMTGPELVATYNRLGGPAVKRFATRAVALRRTWATVQEWKAAHPVAKAKPAAVSAKAIPAAVKTKPQPAGQRCGTNIQPNGEPLKACREGSKQAILLDLLRQPAGATMGELMAALSWRESSVKTGFGWDMKQKGYGVRSATGTDGVERFYIVVPDGQKVPAHVGGGA